MLTHMTFPDFKALCEQRRSIRYFDTTPLTPEEIRDILETGHLAPNVHNLQPWRFHVVTDRRLLKDLMEASCYGDFVAGAASFIVVTCDTNVQAPAQDPVWNPQELEYSCMAAMTQMLLGATAMGIGSCWVSLHHGTAHDALKLAHGEQVMGGIMLGHLKKGEVSASNGHQRRPLDEVTVWHGQKE